MISTAILRCDAGRIRGVAKGGIKIDDAVESPRRSNPLIHRHAFRLTGCGPGANAMIRKNGRSENLEAAGMRASNDLSVSRDDFIHRHLRPVPPTIGIRGRCVWLTNVVG